MPAGGSLVTLLCVRLRDLLYSVYERRLAAALESKPHPRHVGVIVDGNRRWAREMGYVDPNDGHRVGAAKIKELLRWCDQAGSRRGLRSSGKTKLVWLAAQRAASRL